MKHYLLMTVLMLSTFGLRAQDEAVNPFKAEVHEDQKIQLLTSGLAALEARLQAVERAQKTIDVEYFIYATDKSGKLFTDALIKKAKEGVKVRLLLDWFMVKGQLSPFYAHELEKFGIEIKYYNPTSILNFIKYQFRNHRKSVIIDSKEIVTGGRNLADEYFDLDESYYYLDRDVVIEGSLVTPIQATFNEIWNSHLSKRVARERMPKHTDGKYFRTANKGMPAGNYQLDIKQWNKQVTAAVDFVNKPGDERFQQDFREKAQTILEGEYKGVCHDMNFDSEYPMVGLKSAKFRMIKHVLAEKFKSAKSSVLFESPYYILDKTASEALEVALANKVDMKVISNSFYSSDATYIMTAFNSIIKKWIGLGLKPHLINGHLPDGYESLNDVYKKARVGIHAKTYVFDDKDVTIGSYNFDPRSSNINAEMVVSCNNNPEFAEAVTKDMNLRLKSSVLLDSPSKVDKMKFFRVGFMKRLEFILLKLPTKLVHFIL